MKTFFQICLLLVAFTACSNASEKDEYVVIKPKPGESSSETGATMKGICIFFGQASAYTAEDWKALADSYVTDFVLIPKETDSYGNTEEGYKTQLAPAMADFVKQLASRRTSAKIWIGTPGLTSKNFQMAASSLNPIYNYVTEVRDLVGTSVWTNNVAGVYMNQEAVYGSVDYSNIMANSCIKLMNDLSYRVHTNLDKKFLWIPYYGYGTDPNEIIKKIGYVASKSTIFDYVVIQPHYYFDSSVPQNLTGVRYCVKDQTISYRDGSPVITKASKTVVGAEMEMSWRIVPPNDSPDFLKLYNGYVSAFSEYTGKYPIIFYYDGAIQSALQNRINPFFQSK